MSKHAIIVGKGNSLLSGQLGYQIDEFDTVIRVNHTPNPNFYHTIGSKTDIYSCRYSDKLSKDLDYLYNKSIWQCCWESLITHNDRSVLSQAQKQKCQIHFLDHHNSNSSEYRFLKRHFSKEKPILINEADNKYGFCMPDTGVTTIALALLRLKDYKIYVCGFDLYTEGNKNIYESKSSKSIFQTPVLNEILFYKSLLKLQLIHELR